LTDGFEAILLPVASLILLFPHDALDGRRGGQRLQIDPFSTVVLLIFFNVCMLERGRFFLTSIPYSLIFFIAEGAQVFLPREGTSLPARFQKEWRISFL